MASYPNRDALRDAHDIYLNAMHPFITKNAPDVIEGETDIDDIAHIISKYWYDSFKQRFEDVDPHYQARSAAWQVVESRNRASHPPWDIDPEFTRTHLFLIANLLEKINRPDAKRKVDDIRDRLFSHESEEHVSDVSDQLKTARAENAELEKLLKDKSDRLEDMEAERATYEKRLETTLAQLEEVEDELDDCNEELDRTRRQLKELINSNTPDSIIFYGTTFTKHFDQYCVRGSTVLEEMLLPKVSGTIGTH